MPNNDAAFQLRTTSGAPMNLATWRKEGGGGDRDGGVGGGVLVRLGPESPSSDVCGARSTGREAPYRERAFLSLSLTSSASASSVSTSVIVIMCASGSVSFQRSVVRRRQASLVPVWTP